MYRDRLTACSQRHNRGLNYGGWSLRSALPPVKYNSCTCYNHVVHEHDTIGRDKNDSTSLWVKIMMKNHNWPSNCRAGRYSGRVSQAPCTMAIKNLFCKSCCSSRRWCGINFRTNRRPTLSQNKILRSYVTRTT